ncbi:MAG: acylase, partial [Cyanobacteria bacterium P01_E01_bin.42]
MLFLKRRFFLVLLLICSICFTLFLGDSSVISKSPTEILWDIWGVPHIFARDNMGIFKAFGYAQMQSHGNLILRLYGQARGRAAEYWGEEYLPSDRYVRRMGIPNRARVWYEEQSPEIQQYLAAFVTGMNLYVEEHPEAIDEALKVALPITETDILAHLQRVIYFDFLVSDREVSAWRGSNAWAIAPSRSQSGNALLLTNPHLPWQDFYLLYEAHLNAPDLNVYGSTLVGMPALVMAFNDNLGWTLTVNPIQGKTFYNLRLTNDGYWLDGIPLTFKRENQTIKIKQDDGSFREEELTIERSRHGVVIKKTEDEAIALRVAGLDRPQVIEQVLNMAKATNLAEFETAISQLQLPMFNLLYADKAGEIAYIFNGLIPKREGGTYRDWSRSVSGDTSKTLWTQYHPYEDLPRLVNPETGWLQNTNDPPWSATFPQELNPRDYPAYFAPQSLGEAVGIFRTQRSLKKLLAEEKMSFEELIEAKFSSRLELGDRLVDELVAAAKKRDTPISLEAAEVLEKWDREATKSSKGAALFGVWRFLMGQENFFATPWNSDDPLNTPQGLKDSEKAIDVLENAAAQLQLLYGKMDVNWGAAVRLRYGNKDLPASGAPGTLGSFQVVGVVPAESGKFQSIAGDTYIAVVEFSEPIRARVLNVCGNSTQPNSPHLTDQLSQYARGQLRPVWRDPEEIKKHL